MYTQKDRSTALRDAFRRAQGWGPISWPPAFGLGAGLLAAFVSDTLLRGTLAIPWRQVLDATVFAVAGGSIWLMVQRPEVRQAHEVMTWLNGWETERWQAEIGRRLTATPRATPGLLDRLPDTMSLRPLRVELLAARGKIAEARARLDALPTDTAWQRFERAALDEWVSWLANDSDRRDAMRSTISEISDEERMLAARVMLAAADARRAATEGGDAIAPLAAIRPSLGDRPGRYAFGYRSGVIAALVLIGVVAVVAFSATAAITR